MDPENSAAALLAQLDGERRTNQDLEKEVRILGFKVKGLRFRV